MWSDWLTPLRWLSRGILFLFLLLVCTPPTVLFQYVIGPSVRVGGKTLDERMLNGWATLACVAFGVRRRVIGAALPGPVLLVSNHISWLDIQVLHSVAAMSFVAKAEIQNWPLMGFMASSGGTVYHRRGSHDSASGVVAQLLDKLSVGGRVAIFPEGGILPGEEIKRFHARMFRVSVEADCPIQPVMIRYVRDDRRNPGMTFINNESFVVNALRLMGRPACIAELHFLDPFEPAGRPRRELAEQAQAQVEAAYIEPANATGGHGNS